jgi:hypothetical protein
VVIQLNDATRPFNGDFDTNSSWLRPCPQFEILNPVVASDPISMMNGFAINQAANVRFGSTTFSTSQNPSRPLRSLGASVTELVLKHPATPSARRQIGRYSKDSWTTKALDVLVRCNA